VGLRGMGEVELAERLLELAANTVERSSRICGDHRADELERETDRSGLEWGQSRRCTEGVSEELLVDPNFTVLELGVDGVAPAAGGGRVEQREVPPALVGRGGGA